MKKVIYLLKHLATGLFFNGISEPRGDGFKNWLEHKGTEAKEDAIQFAKEEAAKLLCDHLGEHEVIKVEEDEEVK